jgi:hypothetical protein
MVENSFLKRWGLPLSALVLILIYFAVRALLEGPAIRPPLRTVIALAPVPFFVLFLFSFHRAVRQLDEMQQRVQLEALAIAFPTTLLILMTLGLLQVAGIALSPADWSYRHVLQIAIVLYFLGVMFAQRRYR